MFPVCTQQYMRGSIFCYSSRVSFGRRATKLLLFTFECRGDTSHFTSCIVKLILRSETDSCWECNTFLNAVTASCHKPSNVINMGNFDTVPVRVTMTYDSKVSMTGATVHFIHFYTLCYGPILDPVSHWLALLTVTRWVKQMKCIR